LEQFPGPPPVLPYWSGLIITSIAAIEIKGKISESRKEHRNKYMLPGPSSAFRSKGAKDRNPIATHNAILPQGATVISATS